jgi:hypothetical protein
MARTRAGWWGWRGVERMGGGEEERQVAREREERNKTHLSLIFTVVNL